MEHVDLLIVGSGPGGYVAALRAGQLDARVMMVEKSELGGTCLNWGCIPTKTLHKSASLYGEMKRGEEFGFEVGDLRVRYDLVSQRKNRIVDDFKESVKKLLKARGVKIVNGRCELKADKQAEITLTDGSTLDVSADKVIIATGSEPATSNLPGADLPNVISTGDVLAMEELVDDMVVIGGGVTGIELAGIMAEFGVNVSVVKRTPYISPIDSDLAKRLFSILKRSGLNVLTESQVKEIAEGDDGKLVVRIERKGKEQELPADKVLISRGRNPHKDGLEALELEETDGFVKVDEKLETNLPGVYAIGDVCSQGPMLAHVASHQGVIAVENALLDEGKAYDDSAVPNCVFTVTEVACVGESEDSLKEQEIPYKVGRFPFGANGKAMAEGQVTGQVKMLSHADTEEILGLHIMGPHAADLIQEGTLAVQQGLKVSDLGDLIHPHPTLSETVWEAALDTLEMPLHQLPQKKKKQKKQK